MNIGPPDKVTTDISGQRTRVSEENAPEGPSLGPVAPGPATTEDNDLGKQSTSATASFSYAALQAERRSLTMPPVPNFDIPDSPPGSPPPESTKKFEQFLKLKKDGVHFNERLANSNALRNPSLFQKLIAHAGLDQSDQYASAQPADLAVPTMYPPWAYGDKLNKAQQEILKKREEEKKTSRKAPEFVAASKSANASRGGTPSSIGSKNESRLAQGLSRPNKEKDDRKRRKLTTD